MSEAAQPPLPEEDQPKELEQEEKKGTSLTNYVILKKHDPVQGVDENGWGVVKAVQEARSAKAAVLSYFNTPDASKDGTYVAVPVRSWDPITVKTETRVVVS